MTSYFTATKFSKSFVWRSVADHFMVVSYRGKRCQYLRWQRDRRITRASELDPLKNEAPKVIPPPQPLTGGASKTPRYASKLKKALLWARVKFLFKTGSSSYFGSASRSWKRDQVLVWGRVCPTFISHK